MSFTYTVSCPMESMEVIGNLAVEGYMASYEQRAFMYHLGLASKCAAEIGAYCGLSSVLVGLGMKNTGQYYCIDTFEASSPELPVGNTFEKWWQAITRYGLQHTCIPIKGWSYDPEVYGQIPGHLDFVYIDGNHETDSVLLDALLYRSKVRPNGLLIFHDTPWPTVKTAVNTLLEMEWMTVLRVINDCTVCRVTDFWSAKARELLVGLLTARNQTLQ